MLRRSAKYHYRRIKTPPEHGEQDDQLQKALDEINSTGGEIVSILSHGSNWFTIVYKA